MKQHAPIRSVSRAISILQVINHAGSISMVDIAERAGLAYPTAFRIVQALMHEGVIEREPSRKLYRAAALAQTLSLGFQNHGRLVTRSRPFIVALTNKMGWPVTLATQVGQQMVIRDSTHSLTSLTFNHYYPGYTMPILECAVGRVYLAHTSPEERADILGTLRSSLTYAEHHVLHLFETGELTVKIRGDGYACSESNLFTLNPGKTSSIAVPLLQGDAAVGALALVFFSSAMRIEDALEVFIPELRETAEHIGKALLADQIDDPP